MAKEGLRCGSAGRVVEMCKIKNKRKDGFKR